MYPVKISYGEEDKGFIATVPDLPGCSAFGTTEEEALKEIKIAQELWLETARSENRHIPRPSSDAEYSGRILLRTPRSLHRTLMEKAKEEGVSLNQFILYLLSQSVQATKKTKWRQKTRLFCEGSKRQPPEGISVHEDKWGSSCDVQTMPPSGERGNRTTSLRRR